MDSCRICGGSDLSTFTAREMMFGSKEEFDYQLCASCSSLQIKDIPNNLSKHYPENYNAYHKGERKSRSAIKRIFKRKMASDFLNDRVSFFSKFLIKQFGLGYVNKMKHSNVSLDSEILDVGTGNGARLLGLYDYGFTNLKGIEPFIEKDLSYDNGVKVLASDIYSHKGSYDLIMFNHVFEHVIDPGKVLIEVDRLLKKGGTVQISIPVADSEAFSIYKENWVALDPPRHLHIFSKLGIRSFVQKYGFEVYNEFYDGSSYQFWGSEQYKKDIPLRSDESYYSNQETSIFSPEKILEYQNKAQLLNEEQKGDTACFYLKRMN